MKSLLISLLIIAVLVLLALQKWQSNPATGDGAGSARFIGRCVETAADHADPKAYCSCLWRKGVTKVSALVSSEKGRQAAAECRRGKTEADED